MSNKYIGISLQNWILIALLLLYFFIFYNNDLYTVVCVEKSGVPTLTPEKFSDTQNKIKVINFDTDWCGYSVRFQPEWKKFVQLVKEDESLSHVETSNIKCDNPTSKQLCTNYDIPGFPTVIIENNNSRKQYEGPRTADALIEAIKNL